MRLADLSTLVSFGFLVCTHPPPSPSETNRSYNAAVIMFASPGGRRAKAYHELNWSRMTAHQQCQVWSKLTPTQQNDMRARKLNPHQEYLDYYLLSRSEQQAQWILFDGPKQARIAEYISQDCSFLHFAPELWRHQADASTIAPTSRPTSPAQSTQSSRPSHDYLRESVAPDRPAIWDQ